MLKHLSPKEIESVIKQSVIGQDTALQAVSTAISAHISRLKYNSLNMPNRIKRITY